MPPTKKSSPAKAPAKKPMHVKKHVVPAPPKSQYELERDERIKRNEKFMLSIGLNPYGSGGYVKQNTKKAPPKPRAPKYVPESERRRSPRLAGETAGPERLTYDDWSGDERPRHSRGFCARASSRCCCPSAAPPSARRRPPGRPPDPTTYSADYVPGSHGDASLPAQAGGADGR